MTIQKIKILLMLVSIFCRKNAFAEIYNSPIEIDGVTYSDYAILSNTKTGDNVYTHFQHALNSNKEVVIVDEGVFTTNIINRVYQNNKKIIGVDKTRSKIIQTNPTKDLLQIYANNVTVKNLTLDTKTNNAFAALAIGDGNPNSTGDETLRGNNNIIENNNILGGKKAFTLFVAGPTYKTADAIYNAYSLGKLNYGNTIKNNYMEGVNVNGDTFIFALQKNGTFENNTLSGGMLAVYMDSNVNVNNNTIKNSNKTAIYISGPCNTLQMNGNIIDKRVEHGIKSYYQMDNIPIPTEMKYIVGTTLSGNTLTNIGYTGLELNYFKEGNIQNNYLYNIGLHGIGLSLDSNSNIVYNNHIEEFDMNKINRRGSGIFVTVLGSNNQITNNTIILKTSSFAGIFIETNDSIGNSIITNTINGKFTQGGIVSYRSSNDITIGSNTIASANGKNIIYK